MENKEQGKESSIEYQERTASARTRRGFLKHAATTGIAGIASLALSTGAASAHSQIATVYGLSGWSSYYIYATGDIDRSGAAEDGISNPGYDSDHGDHIRGRVKEGGEDSFTYSGKVYSVSIDGHVSMDVTNTSGREVGVYGQSGWSSYSIHSTGDIALWDDTEEGSSDPGRDTDYGEYVRGHVKEGGQDYYLHTDEVWRISINGYASMSMY